MISEGSCDTEDWSNDAENSALQQNNKLQFKTLKWKTLILNCNTILQYYCFWSNKCSLSEHNIFFKNIKKILLKKKVKRFNNNKKFQIDSL